MSTVKQLASELGVSTKTIHNQQKNGYALVLNDSSKIDIKKSIHAFVKHQSEMLRKIKAQKGRDSVGNSGNSNEPKNADEWKTEKEKQGAIKLKLSNERDVGDSVPVEAIFELYNGPLSLIKRHLIDLSSQIQRRIQIDPSDIKVIDDVVRAALEGLNEKGHDELQPLIREIIERYSKYYSTATEDSDHCVVND